MQTYRTGKAVGMPLLTESAGLTIDDRFGTAVAFCDELPDIVLATTNVQHILIDIAGWP